MNVIAGSGTDEKLKDYFASLSPTEEAVVVVIESKYQPHDFLSDCKGFDEALKIAHLGAPMVLLGWQSPAEYARNPKWHALMAHPNVAFVRLPPLPEEVEAALVEIKTNPRPADPLALQLFKVTAPENSLGTLHHDLESAFRICGERKERWLAGARMQFGNLYEDELVTLVKERKEPTDGPLAGQEFPDVCVDVEGTLIDKDGQIRARVLEKVTELSKTQPITVWTGGDLKAMEEIIRKAGITWKLAPKSLFRGAKVAMVIDDLDQTEFIRLYSVACDTYIQA